jgi:hypothetical protein
MQIVVAILAVLLVTGAAIAVSLVRSKRLAAIGGASLLSGLAHPWLALAVAFLLCGYATFVIWASRSLEVFGSPMYFAFSPVAVTLCALLFCVWVLARSIVVWRARTRLWRFFLGIQLFWAIALFVAQLELPARIGSRTIGY